MAEKYREETKTTTSYYCLLCGGKYNTPEEAEDCYDSHATLDSSCQVLDITYAPKIKYPSSVKLRFIVKDKNDESNTRNVLGWYKLYKVADEH